MIDLDLKVNESRGLKFGFEVKVLDEDVIDDIERLKVSMFSVVGDLVGLGEDMLVEYRRNGDSFGVIDSNNDYVMIFRFVDDVVVIRDVMRLENLKEY